MSEPFVQLNDYAEAVRQEDEWLDDLESYRTELDAAFCIYDVEEMTQAYEILRRLEGNTSNLGTKVAFDKAMIAYGWHDIFNKEFADWEDEADRPMEDGKYDAQCEDEALLDRWLYEMRYDVETAFRVCDYGLILDAFALLEGTGPRERIYR